MKKFFIRKPNRLQGYDYSSNGAYFITICTRNKECILWRINSAPVAAPTGRHHSIQLSEYGEIVDKAIIAIPQHYEGIRIDNYVIMPNHIHLLISINSAEWRPMGAATVSRVLNQFKGFVTKQIGTSIWQNGFNDHVIRDYADYLTKWKYIDDNPYKWDSDEYFLR